MRTIPFPLGKVLENLKLARKWEIVIIYFSIVLGAMNLYNKFAVPGRRSGIQHQ